MSDTNEEENNILPEDDSIFENIDDCDVRDVTSDSILDDSFSSVHCSTPAEKGQPSPRPLTRSLVKRPFLGVPDQPASPRRTRTTASASSPRPQTRSQTNSCTPSVSPQQQTRRQTGSATPSSAGQGVLGVTPLPLRQVAAAPRFPSKLKCPLCPSVLANETTLATHKKRHAFKRAFARAASEQDFLCEMPVLVIQSLEKILKEPRIGTVAESVNKFARVISDTMPTRDESHEELFKYLCDQLYCIFRDYNSIFASTLQYVILVGVNKLLNSFDFRDEIRGYILGLPVSEAPDSVETLNVFITNFVMQLGYSAIVFYIKKIHGSSASQEIRKKRSDDNVDSATFLQMAYYIGGSVVSGYLYKGDKFKATSWKKFVTVLRSKFLRVQAVGNACADEVREFTESRDRGGLKHISQEALDFFVVLFDLLMSLEGSDGSLPECVIDEHVLTNDAIICLWDNLVGSDLDEDSSMDYSEQMARTCRNVVMKGIMKRKLNEHLKKAVSSVSLRSRLAQ